MNEVGKRVILPYNSICTNGWQISNTQWANTQEDMTIHYATVNYSLLPKEPTQAGWEYKGNFSEGQYYVGCGGYLATFKSKEDAEAILREHPEWEKYHFEIFYQGNL